MAPATLTTQGAIARLTLNQAPVNGLGLPLRQAIVQGLEQAEADPHCEFFIVHSALDVFCAGADIGEFSNPALATASPNLPEVLNRFNRSRLCIIAEINNLALGGGLELAMGADYRVASAHCQLGLPEINLGLIPGGGGTQRLPRLTSVSTAIEMITSGKPINTAKAQSLGLIDSVAEDDLEQETEALVQRICRDALPRKRLLQEAAAADQTTLINARTKAEAAGDAGVALRAAVEAVAAATETPLDQGQAREAALFQDCLASSQSRALRHLFFATREAQKIPGLAKETPTRAIARVGIVGSGTMGGGIAMNFLNAGLPVTMLDLNEDNLNKGMATLRANYQHSVKRGKLSEVQLAQRMQLLTGTTQYKDLADCDLVIEAVFEKMEVKQAVFASLDSHCKASCILATNTSTLDVNQMALATEDPSRVIGLHFFSPANVMPLLEIVRAATTADEVLATALKLAKTIRKTAVVVGVCFGFVGNRMLEPYMREGMRLLLEGASPRQIDAALQGFGMAMGLCAMGDLAGLDIGYAVRQGRPELGRGDASYAALADALVEAGRCGQKTGAGFYRYDGRTPIDDPEVTALAERLAQQHGITRRTVTDTEIVERMLFSLINEGACILEEGIALRAGDIDLVYVNGYGFPAWRGGPMAYAAELGWDHVLARLAHYRETLGDYGERWFNLSPWLRQQANNLNTTESAHS